jgi:fused signal recognition particle receptor
MNSLLNTINSYPAVYADIFVVFVLALILYLLTLFISKIFSGKETSEVDEAVIEEKPTITPPEEVPVDLPPSEPVLEEVQDAFKAAEFLDPEIPEPATITEEIPVIVQEESTTDDIVTEEIEQVETVEEPQAVSEAESVFSRLRKGLSKTQTGLFGKLDGIFSRNEIDQETWDEFEESLISSDIGVSTTMKLREVIAGSGLKSPSEIKSALKTEILNILKNAEGGISELKTKPTVVMVVGVNGVGKTTTIGKLANKFIKDGNKVMVAAADTFRAAAIEQLEIWSQRVGSDFIKGSPGADPSAVAFDAVQASQARDTDLLIVDTAGRLHTKTNLMDELKKINRILGREISDSPHEVLIVLDATTGQNAVQQAKSFNEAIDISGIVLTKLDGTAKGGVIIAIADELNIPVKYIGIGEALEDLREFNADEFVEALFDEGGSTVH